MKKVKDIILNTIVTINFCVVGWWIISYMDVVINRPDITNWNWFHLFL